MFKKKLLIVALLVLMTGVCFADVSSDSQQGFEAQKRLVMDYIHAGRTNQAKAELAKLQQDYAANPEMTESLYWIARRYVKAGKFEQANELFSQIAEQDGDSVYASKIALNLPTASIMKRISLKNLSEAETETADLIASFAGHDGLPEALYDIARRYKEKGHYLKAKELQQYILDNHGGSSYENWCRLDVHKMTICTAIEAGDFSTVNEQVNLLISQYGSNKKLPQVLNFMAVRHEWVGEYTRAKNLHQRVIGTFGGSKGAAKSQLDIDKCDVLALIDSGEHDAAIIAVDSLITRYSDNSYLSEALSKGIAILCHRKAVSLEGQEDIDGAEVYYQLAADVWEKAVELGGGDAITAQACLMVGECHRLLGDIEKSNQYCQKFVDDWPMDKLRWHGLSILALNYQQLGKDGGLSKAEADSGTQAAYQELLEQYPDSKAAQSASKWLGL